MMKPGFDLSDLVELKFPVIFRKSAFTGSDCRVGMDSLKY